MATIVIRTEADGDASTIRAIHQAAFGGSVEADIVDALRHVERVSLVAEVDGQLAGHILFTPAIIRQTDGREVQGMGLAPLAVLPERQGGGIGTRLVERGIAALHQRHCAFVIVLGHPEYYTRFGFERGSRHGIACQWPNIPDEAFMVLPLDRKKMSNVTGTAMYHDVFDAAV